MRAPKVALQKLQNLRLRTNNLDDERLKKKQATDWIRILWGAGHEIVFPELATDGNAARWLLERLLRHSESVFVPIYGNEGEALADICEKLGSDVITVEQERGAVFEQESLIAELRRRKPSMLIIVHGEIATGQLQPLDKLGRVCRELDILFLVDVAATSGIVPFAADDWHADAVFTGPAPCLAGSANLQAIAYNDGVKARLRGDFEASRDEGEHPIVPIDYQSILDAIAYRAGRPIGDAKELIEGYDRRKRNEEAIIAGLKAAGLRFYGRPESRFPSTINIEIPEGMDGESLRQRLRGEYHIPCHCRRPSSLKSMTLRIEIEAAHVQNRDVAVGWLKSMTSAFAEAGYDCDSDAAVSAADQAYELQRSETTYEEA